MRPRQSITLDVGKRRTKRECVTLGGGDVNGTDLVVTVTEDGRPFDCSEYVPFLMVPVGDGCYRQEGEAAGSVATITIDESQLGGHVGFLTGAYLSLEGEDVVTSTQRFDVEVLRPADGSEVASLETRLAEAEATIAELMQRIAELEPPAGLGMGRQ